MQQMRYFSSPNFECPVCHLALMDDDFIFMLDFLRYKVGHAMWVNSGYR